MNLESIFGPHERALAVGAKRSEMLASNLVNSDTPGYKAKDIDFRAALANANGSPERLVTTNAHHITDDSVLVDSDIKYRVPLQMKVDGNTVDTQVENSKFTENSMRYMASLRFLDNKIKNLMLSIRGE